MERTRRSHGPAITHAEIVEAENGLWVEWTKASRSARDNSVEELFSLRIISQAGLDQGQIVHGRDYHGRAASQRYPEAEHRWWRALSLRIALLLIE